MSANLWKGIFAMWSICIKFKPSSGWRPYVRYFDTFLDLTFFVDNAWAKWPIWKVHVFSNGQHVRYWTMCPGEIAERRRKARLQKLGREIY